LILIIDVAHAFASLRVSSGDPDGCCSAAGNRYMMNLRRVLRSGRAPI
jgi:hypothetical protein